VILIALGLNRALTVAQLMKITGLSRGELYNILIKLKRKGLVRSNSPRKQSILCLPIPNEYPISWREKLYMLTTELEKLWEDQEFRQTASELFETSSLEEIKRKFMKFQEIRNKQKII